jgi:hypothetical protein
MLQQRVLRGWSRWVTSLNASCASAPLLTMSAFLSLRSSSWYALVFALNAEAVAAHFSFGPEWAVGYLVMRVSGKLRQPLNVAVAAALLKAFPVLSTVKASALMGVMAPSAPAPEQANTSGINAKVQQLMKFINGPLDKYGFAYYLASKFSIALVIWGSAVAVKHGVDVHAQLTNWGIGESLQQGAGSMAGATMINLINLPMHLYVLPSVLRLIGVYRARFFDTDKASLIDRSTPELSKSSDFQAPMNNLYDTALKISADSRKLEK